MMTLRLIAPLLIVFMLAGCVASPPAGRAAINNFAHIAPIHLNVADIHIEDRYVPPLKMPNIEHRLVNPPYHAAYNMLSRAFEAVGANYTLNIYIDKAEILDADGYQGRIEASVTLDRSVPPYEQVGKGEVKVRRSLELPGSVSAADRELALNAMVEEMVADLHSGLVRIFENKFKIIGAKNAG